MKNLKILIITIAVLIVSCNKYEEQNYDLVDRVSNISVYNLLLNPNDLDDQAVNMIMYDWGLEVRNIMNDQNDYLSILNTLMSDSDNTMSFEDLQIATNVDEFTYDNVIYKPFLWLYNGNSTINDELSPYLCFSTDIDAELALGDNYNPNEEGDFIAGWELVDDYPTEVFNFDDAESIEEPFFIIGFSPSDIDNFSLARTTQVDHPIEPEGGYKRYWTKFFKIHSRYDNTKRSEVRFYFHLVIDGSLKNACKTNVFEIHKDDLNVWKNCSFPMYWSIKTTYGWVPQKIENQNTVGVIGLVYEYDWWSLIREKIIISSPDNSAEIKYRTKYSSHYYEIYNEVDLTYLNNGEYHIGSSAKIYQDE